jgi:hypothetical protein
MRLSVKLLLFLFFITFLNYSSMAEIRFLGKDTLDLRGTFRFLEGSSYFDTNGDDVLELLMEGQEGEDDPLTRVFTINKYTLDIKADYYVSDELIISGQVPFSLITYKEEKDSLLPYRDLNTSDTVWVRERFPGYNASLFQADFYQLGAKYVFYQRRAYAAVAADFRLPGNFSNYERDTSNKELEYGSTTELLIGLIIGARFGESYVESSFSYNKRTGDFSDQMQINIEGAFSAEKGTQLRFRTLFIMNNDPLKDAIPMDPRKPIFSEDMLMLGATLRLAISGNFYTDIGYQKVLYGKNTWNVGEFVLTAGFLLK